MNLPTLDSAQLADIQEDYNHYDQKHKIIDKVEEHEKDSWSKI